MKHLVLLFLLALPFSPACSDGDSSGSASVSSANVDQFLASYASLYCNAFAPCCSAKGYDASGSQCRALISGQDRDKLDVAAYDPARGQKCLDEIQSYLASTDICADGTDPEESGQTPSCENVLPQKGGQLKIGELCQDDDQCASVAGAKVECYTYTKFSDGGSQQFSYCRAVRPGKAGDSPCVATIDGNTTFFQGSDEQVNEGFSCNMAAGLHCSSSDSVPSCKAILQDGQECSFGDRCQKNSLCTGGKCTPKAAVGASCSGFDSCVEGAECDAKTSTCVALLPEGSPCELGSECASKGCVNKKCSGGGGGLEDFAYSLLCGPKK
ncbi:MAG: hypothetical protein MUF64_26010 [Polyangiaceae bacterium]|jgi:hypothetical protein|nr:hypothetical protein [Polyangiaceae bacterium]